MNRNQRNLIIQALLHVSVKDLDFHAARYDSGRLFQQLVEKAHHARDVGPHEVSHLVSTGPIEAMLNEIWEATKGDGGNEGTIPCLGGEPEIVWRAIVEAWMNQDYYDLGAYVRLKEEGG